MRDTRDTDVLTYIIGMIFSYESDCLYGCQTKVGNSIQSCLQNLPPGNLAFTNVPLTKDGLTYVYAASLRTAAITFVSAIRKIWILVNECDLFTILSFSFVIEPIPTWIRSSNSSYYPSFGNNARNNRYEWLRCFQHSPFSVDCFSNISFNVFISPLITSRSILIITLIYIYLSDQNTN